MSGDDAIKTPIEDVEGGWLHQLVIYAATNPWEFCWYLLLCLSPMFFISAMLSWKLAKALEAQEKELAKRRNDYNAFLQQSSLHTPLTRERTHPNLHESKKTI